MTKHEGGFTLLEITLAVIVLGLITTFTLRALNGVDEVVQFQAMSEQAQDLVTFVEKVRKTPTATTVGSPVYPGGSPNSHSYMNLAAGSTVQQFRAAFLTEFGTAPRSLPELSPFETPYLITMTSDISYVEVTVPFNDVDLNRARKTVVGGNTTFRFYPTVETESSGTNRSAGSSFTKSFLTETVR